jgi:hypothetical protein
MVRSTLLIVDFKFLSQSFDILINKVSTLITHQGLRESKLVMISSNINHAVVFSLQSFTSLASAHMVKYAITMMIYLTRVHFLGGLIGPTKSMAHL